MKFEYRSQLPGKAPRRFKVDGWLGTALGILIGVAVIVGLVSLIPFVIAGILGFIGLILFLIVAGWVWLGFKIGWANLWDITKVFFTIVFGRGPLESRFERINKLWENRVKGKHGVWVK
jgi:hypothetical protein